MIKTIIFSFLFFFGIVHAETSIPEIGRIVDVAGVLTAQQKQSLEAKAEAIQESTKTVLVTLIIPKLDDESIFDYSMRVAEKWHPGIEGIDQGVLLVISIADKKVQILTTRNTGQTLTDARSAHLLAEMVKHIKKTKGDYYGAINGYMNDVMPYIQQENVVAPEKSNNVFLWWFVGWFVGFGSILALGGIAYWVIDRRQKKIEREFQRKKAMQERIERINSLYSRSSASSYVAPKRTTTSSSGYLTPVPVVMPESKRSSSSSSTSSNSSSWSSYSSSSSDSYSSSSSSSYDGGSSSDSYSSSSSSSYDGGGSSDSWD